MRNGFRRNRFHRFSPIHSAYYYHYCLIQYIE